MYCSKCGVDLGFDTTCCECSLEESINDSTSSNMTNTNENSNISSKQLKIIICLLIAILMFFTNPTFEEHVAKDTNLNKSFFNGSEALFSILGAEYYDCKFFSLLVRKKDKRVLTLGVFGIVIPSN